ncbi:MAG: TolC family protein, partial [Candidatus Eremiobacteraeota bacterium]|nr:TolC family protein [Candidatus Eremiobacteraeota bacterium]
MRARIVSAVVAAVAVAAAIVPLQRLGAQPDDALPTRATIPTAIPTLILPPVPSVAPGYVAPKAAPGAPAIVGVTAQPFVAISLQDTIAMALVKSPALALSASNIKVARYNIVQTRGAYDLAFHVEPSSSYSVNPPQSFLNAGPGLEGKYGSGSAAFFTPGPGNIVQHQSTFQYGVNGQTENGTTYQGDIQQQRTFNNTTFNAYNPTYLAQLNVAVTQPLLKNAGMNPAKRQLKLAVISADAGEAQSLIDASNAISQAENAYWQLVAAWRNVAIQEAALKEAIDQQRSNVRLAARGAAATVDAVQSQTQVSNFENQVYQALQTVAQLQNQLKILIASNVNDPIWKANLVPSTSVEQPPAANDLAAVVARAREQRPEVRQAEDRKRQADVDVALAKNQSLPQADLQAQYQSNGFAGLLTPVPGFLFGYCTGPSVGLPACPTPPPNTQGTMPFAYHNMWAAY